MLVSVYSNLKRRRSVRFNLPYIMNTNDKDLSVTTFNTVVVEKTKLLATLEVNREKHNAIYNAAVSGYYIESQKVLDKKTQEFKDSLAEMARKFSTYTGQLSTEFSHHQGQLQTNITEQNKDGIRGIGLQAIRYDQFSFNGGWPLAYPQNHLEDYDRVIDLLKFSVADKVELSSQDFDAYVRNNWAWRKSFLDTNTTYLNSIVSTTGCYFPTATNASVGILVSGCAGIVGTRAQIEKQF